jgi:gas vesicle protein
MLFGDDANDAAWWTAVGGLAVGVIGAVAALLAKFWPQLTKNMESKANARLKAEAQTAKLQLAANEQLFAEYRAINAALAARVDRIADEMQERLDKSAQEHGKCLERCRELETKVYRLESHVRRLEEAAAKGGQP